MHDHDDVLVWRIYVRDHLTACSLTTDSRLVHFSDSLSLLFTSSPFLFCRCTSSFFHHATSMKVVVAILMHDLCAQLPVDAAAFSVQF